MVTTKTNTHTDPPLGSRWAQMWAYMWAEQLVIFWYMLPKVTFGTLHFLGQLSDVTGRKKLDINISFIYSFGHKVLIFHKKTRRYLPVRF